MNIETPCFGHQIQGSRDYQEDSFEVQEGYSGYLLLVCDGMGGHTAGDLASELAIEGFIASFSSGMSQQLDVPECLDIGVNGANQFLNQALEKDPQLKGMGTTLLAVFIRDQKAYWASVGDSPLWLIRGNEIKRLNEDHSLAAVFDVLVEQGRMSFEDAQNDPKRNVLRSALKGEDIDIVDICTEPLSLNTDDCLLLASDGLDTLSADQIINSCENTKYDSPQCVNTLLSTVSSQQKPDQDNTTVVCYWHTVGKKAMTSDNKMLSTIANSTTTVSEEATVVKLPIVNAEDKGIRKRNVVIVVCLLAITTYLLRVMFTEPQPSGEVVSPTVVLSQPIKVPSEPIVNEQPVLEAPSVKILPEEAADVVMSERLSKETVSDDVVPESVIPAELPNEAIFDVSASESVISKELAKETITEVVIPATVLPKEVPIEATTGVVIVEELSAKDLTDTGSAEELTKAPINNIELKDEITD